MSDCKIYPADTVDIYGNVWPTVGENIRNGVFGKLKKAKININGNNITSDSSSVKILAVKEYDFTINKLPFILIVDKVYLGQFAMTITYYSSSNSVIYFNNKLETIKADITVFYTE